MQVGYRHLLKRFLLLQWWLGLMPPLLLTEVQSLLGQAERSELNCISQSPE